MISVSCMAGWQPMGEKRDKYVEVESDTMASGGEVKFPSPFLHPGRVSVSEPREDMLWCSGVPVQPRKWRASRPHYTVLKFIIIPAISA